MNSKHKLRSRQVSLARTMKLVLLHVCAFLGLFEVSAWVFRKQLHILCYHGFERQDECQFRPQLFISRNTFERRLRHLLTVGFKVFTLTEALERLRFGSLPKRALVITVDDGFKSTLDVAAPLLATFKLPATLYVTTYYVANQVPVFRLAVQYAFWKSARQMADISTVRLLLGPIATNNGLTDMENAMYSIIEKGEALRSEEERQQLLASLAQALNVDLRPLHEKQLLSLMSAAEIGTLRNHGIEVQLHTHRHRFPTNDRAAAILEIEENRDRLRDIIGATPQHFCYPSGVFDACQWPWLEALGIQSATTCEPGINGPSTAVYGLNRFLDSEYIEFIEFKAELAGFTEILRRVRRFLNPERQSAVISSPD